MVRAEIITVFLSIFVTIMMSLLYYFYLLLPFNFALNPIASVDLPIVRVVIIGIFIAFLSKRLLEKNITVNLSFGSFFIMAWMAWSCLSFVWAIDPSWSYRKIVFLLNFFLLFLVLSLQDRANLEKIIKGYVVGSICIALVAITQSLTQLFTNAGTILHFWVESVLPFFLGHNFSTSVAEYPSLLVNILGQTYFRATGFFPDPHILSYYIAMALPFAFVYGKKSSGYRVGVILLLVAVLLSFSRGGYIGLAVCLVWFMFVTFLNNRGTKFALKIAIILFAFMFVVASPIGSRFWSSFTSEDGSRVERLRLFVESIHYIQERPFLGVGIGNYPFLVKPEAGAREPIYVHNLFLDIAVETGLVGLLLFLGGLFSALILSYRRWAHTKKASYLATHLALIYFLIHSLFEAPLFSVHILPIFFLFLSLCFVQLETDDVIVETV